MSQLLKTVTALNSQLHLLGTEYKNHEDSVVLGRLAGALELSFKSPKNPHSFHNSDIEALYTSMLGMLYSGNIEGIGNKPHDTVIEYALRLDFFGRIDATPLYKSLGKNNLQQAFISAFFHSIYTNDDQYVLKFCKLFALNRQKEIYQYNDGSTFIDKMMMMHLICDDSKTGLKVKSLIKTIYDQYKNYTHRAIYEKSGVSTSVLADLFAFQMSRIYPQSPKEKLELIKKMEKDYPEYYKKSIKPLKHLDANKNFFYGSENNIVQHVAELKILFKYLRREDSLAPLYHKFFEYQIGLRRISISSWIDKLKKEDDYPTRLAKYYSALPSPQLLEIIKELPHKKDMNLAFYEQQRMLLETPTAHKKKTQKL